MMDDVEEEALLAAGRDLLAVHGGGGGSGGSEGGGGGGTYLGLCYQKFGGQLPQGRSTNHFGGSAPFGATCRGGGGGCICQPKLSHTHTYLQRPVAIPPPFFLMQAAHGPDTASTLPQHCLNTASHAALRPPLQCCCRPTAVWCGTTSRPSPCPWWRRTSSRVGAAVCVCGCMRVFVRDNNTIPAQRASEYLTDMEKCVCVYVCEPRWCRWCHACQGWPGAGVKATRGGRLHVCLHRKRDQTWGVVAGPPGDVSPCW